MESPRRDAQICAEVARWMRAVRRGDSSSKSDEDGCGRRRGWKIEDRSRVRQQRVEGWGCVREDVWLGLPRQDIRLQTPSVDQKNEI